MPKSGAMSGNMHYYFNPGTSRESTIPTDRVRPQAASLSNRQSTLL